MGCPHLGTRRMDSTRGPRNEQTGWRRPDPGRRRRRPPLPGPQPLRILDRHRPARRLLRRPDQPPAIPRRQPQAQPRPLHRRYIAAFVQLRHDTPGRAYYRRRRAAIRSIGSPASAIAPSPEATNPYSEVSSARSGQWKILGPRRARQLAGAKQPACCRSSRSVSTILRTAADVSSKEPRAWEWIRSACSGSGHRRRACQRLHHHRPNSDLHMKKP